MLFNNFTFITAAGFDGRGGVGYSIDSRGARKVNDDEDVVLTLEASSLGAGTSIILGGRFLIKEH